MKKILGAALMSAVLVVGLDAGGAVAGKTVTTHDARGDSHRGIDISSVSLVRVPNKVQVKTNFSGIRHNLNGMQYAFDTNPAKKGPEFGAVVYRGKDGDGLKKFQMYKMRGWGSIGALVKCGWRYKWRISGHGPGYFNLTLGKGCFLGSANDGVRVHVRSWDYTKYRGKGAHRHPTYGYYDDMGSAHKFTKFV